jgi:arylsulfatase
VTDGDLVLFVASYRDPAAARSDLERVSSDQDAHDDEIRIPCEVVLRRDRDGKVSVSTDCDRYAWPDALLTGDVGLVVGLFAPSLLMATMVGQGVGASISQLVKKHDEGRMGVDLDTYLPPGGSAIVVLVRPEHLVRVEMAHKEATNSVSIDVDLEDCRLVETALLEVGLKRGDASVG